MERHAGHQNLSGFCTARLCKVGRATKGALAIQELRFFEIFYMMVLAPVFFFFFYEGVTLISFDLMIP